MIALAAGLILAAGGIFGLAPILLRSLRPLAERPERIGQRVDYVVDPRSRLPASGATAAPALDRGVLATRFPTFEPEGDAEGPAGAYRQTGEAPSGDQGLVEELYGELFLIREALAMLTAEVHSLRTARESSEAGTTAGRVA
jgi:hypothetical protein